MPASSFQSAPCATQEMASATLNALLGQAAQGKEYKILDFNVREENGLWIATASIEIIEPEENAKEEDDKKGEGGKETQGGGDAQNDRGIDPYFVLSGSDVYAGAPPVAIPETPEALPGGSGLDPSFQAQDVQSPPPEDQSTLASGPETLMDDAGDLSDKIKTDFNIPDIAAYNVNADALAADRIAETKLAGMNEREMKNLHDEIEKRLKDSPLPDATMPVPDENVTLIPGT